MTPNQRTWVIAISAAVIGAVAGGSISWALIGTTSEGLRADNEQLRAKLAIAEKTADEIGTTTPAPQPSSSDTDTSTSTEIQPPVPPLQRENQPVFAFVTEATTTGTKVKLSVDYAQFLTGDGAAAAAAAAGDESPPPNDYYIANTNTKVRTLPVASDAKFTIALADPNDTKILSATKFADAVNSNTDYAKDALYQFTVKDGTITGGKEQWLP